ncbi:polygalacturonase [Selaginella moellendorffii]|nr:polygalacturonase [Selaginella moellendorffii]|eukprot:XP_002970983.2 polygalacturonase [Selaginella moellendorffii]
MLLLLLLLLFVSRVTSLANAGSMVVSNKFSCWLLISLLLLQLASLTTPSPFPRGRKDDPRRHDNQSLARVIATAPGSKPPSCLNKCDSCTPCQAVQAVQEAPDTVITGIGSRPPSCQNKCNRCLPCQAVQVPTPDPKDEEAKRVSPAKDEREAAALYSNYKPKGWRCQCGNKLFNP